MQLQHQEPLPEHFFSGAENPELEREFFESYNPEMTEDTMQELAALHAQGPAPLEQLWDSLYATYAFIGDYDQKLFAKVQGMQEMTHRELATVSVEVAGAILTEFTSIGVYIDAIQLIKSLHDAYTIKYGLSEVSPQEQKIQLWDEGKNAADSLFGVVAEIISAAPIPGTPRKARMIVTYCAQIIPMMTHAAAELLHEQIAQNVKAKTQPYEQSPQ